MRTRGLIGKRIVEVRQQFYYAEGRRIQDVTALVLEDGTMLWPVTVETGLSEYAHTFGVSRPTRKRGARQ